MASDLLKDPKATNAYLRAHIDTCGDETAGGQVLAQQAQAFGQKLAQASITAEQATSLLHAVTEGPWQKAHKEVLAAAIDTGMRRAVTGKAPPAKPEHAQLRTLLVCEARWEREPKPRVYFLFLAVTNWQHHKRV